MAMNADPTETKNPIANPASDIVLETLRGLKSVPESGLLKTSASPNLPNPTYIPTEIRTTPKTRENNASASNLAGLAKTRNGTSLHPRSLAMFKRIGTRATVPLQFEGASPSRG